MFLRGKLYFLRMNDGDNFVAKHLKDFNITVSQLAYVDIMMPEEGKYITLLCYLQYS
jgi:hypothetical protein